MTKKLLALAAVVVLSSGCAPWRELSPDQQRHVKIALGSVAVGLVVGYAIADDGDTTIVTVPYRIAPPECWRDHHC